ncbi:M15 family metallopeptidase [Steroidobacter agaridevorans]|uniref:M15 family metallopeptidase n=1 Tax=Steroidobacter agaridevorans TaxID=2695856 RepID=UPI00192A1817|nr:M15 family metallopeptidase [Steroidobacter agaridevorans]
MFTSVRLGGGLLFVSLALASTGNGADVQGEPKPAEAAPAPATSQDASGGIEQGIFRIKPLRPVAVLREEAMAAQPPTEQGTFRAADLVDLATLDPTIRFDIRYATANNFLSTPLYDEPRAFLQRPAADALSRAHRALMKQGYGLLIHDAYRPWWVTKVFWEATPVQWRKFVADPSQGSRHNRGCAVDLTLYDLKTGAAVQMPGLYDEMSERSYPSYAGGTREQRRLRDVLRASMEREGFSVYETEWWHFDFKDWQQYPILNIPFEALDNPSDVPAATANNSLAGVWAGELASGEAKLPLALSVKQLSGGEYVATMSSVKQGASFTADALSLTADAIRFEIKPIGGVYQGKLDADGAGITGTWRQSGVPEQPLSFKRSSAAPAAKPATQQGPASKPFSVPMNVNVPIAPTTFSAGGKAHLAYELHITNLGQWELQLLSLEVVDAEDASRVFAAFSQADLERMMRQASEKTMLGPQQAGVVFVWVTFDRLHDAPTRLSNRFKVRLGDYPETIAVQTRPLAVAQNSLVIGAPLSGERWVAANGPSNTSGHRRALIPVDGHAAIAQRFAIDWVQVGDDGKTYRGDPKDNKNYYAFSHDALAVADGVVAAVLDGIPENVPGIDSRAQPITLANVGGNYVQLDVGGGLYAFYAHLQPGSLRVKVGDKVRRGQAIGRVGNTGNSTEPHLHFHISNSPEPLGAEGFPYALRRFEVQGSTKVEGDEIKAQLAVPGKSETRAMAIPADGEIVKFDK